MSKDNTAASNVIPFQFEARQVRTMLIDDQPWFVAADACASLAIANVSLAVNGRADRTSDGLDDDEKGIATVNTPSGAQDMLVVNESGLYALIFKSRKAEAKRFKKWVTAEVLPAIRKHGRYDDNENRMPTLMDELIGMSELNVIKGLIRDKARGVPADHRQGFQLVMHNRLHTRFNVPRTELIPAGQFEQACNFIAAYAVHEGEFIARGDDSHGTIEVPIPTSMVHRLLVSLGPDGKPRVRDIPIDACVMTVQQLLRALVEPNGLAIKTEELFDFMAAATQNLKSRSLRLARGAIL